ncbi:MAG TPA: GNAT family N-acetyltransferase [Actinomycetota bacterium]
MTGELERALELARWTVERTSTRIEPWAFGTAFFNDDFPKRYDANFVRFDRTAVDVAADRIAKEADRALAGLSHRKVEVEDEAVGAGLAPGLVADGYGADRTVVMALRRNPDRPGGVGVDEVSFEEIRDHLVDVNREERWGQEPGVAEMLADFRRALVEGIGARFFVARASDGTIASSCELYVHGAAAQVESVGTLPAQRGRGLARACVLRAADEGRAAGAHEVFIWADANDWPQHLYERLGFDPIGHVWSFLKEPRGTA